MRSKNMLECVPLHVHESVLHTSVSARLLNQGNLRTITSLVSGLLAGGRGNSSLEVSVLGVHQISKRYLYNVHEVIHSANTWLVLM